MFIICLATGLSTSVYNTLGELQLSSIKEDKLPYTVLNNAIFQMTAFVVNVPIGLAGIQDNSLFGQWDFVLLAALTGFGFQAYSFHKFFILNDPDVDGSMIISSLDLIRRILVNILSYTVLREEITTFNLVSNILLLFASGFLFYSSNRGQLSSSGTDPQHTSLPTLDEGPEHDVPSPDTEEMILPDNSKESDGCYDLEMTEPSGDVHDKLGVKSVCIDILAVPSSSDTAVI